MIFLHVEIRGVLSLLKMWKAGREPTKSSITRCFYSMGDLREVWDNAKTTMTSGIYMNILMLFLLVK